MRGSDRSRRGRSRVLGGQARARAGDLDLVVARLAVVVDVELDRQAGAQPAVTEPAAGGADQRLAGAGQDERDAVGARAVVQVDDEARVQVAAGVDGLVRPDRARLAARRLGEPDEVADVAVPSVWTPSRLVKSGNSKATGGWSRTSQSFAV